MRAVTLIFMLLMASFEGNAQHCIIEESISTIKDTLSSSTNAATIVLISTYYNCLSRSDTSDHYNSMSVSILYIRSDDPNSTHEVRYNVQCNITVWEIVGNLSTALKNNNTRYCEGCTDQNVNEHHCTGYIGRDIGK